MLDPSEVREKINREIHFLRRRRRWELVSPIILIAAFSFTNNGSVTQAWIIATSAVVFACMALARITERDITILELLAAVTAKKATESSNSPDMGLQT
jgi:hypothetical protein